MTLPQYEYSNGDLLKVPLKYTYTSFLGEPFLAAWTASREDARAQLEDKQAPDFPTKQTYAPHGNTVEAADLLDFLAAQNNNTDEFRHWLGWVIQRFEVSKRIHSAYTIQDNKVKGNGNYSNMDLYLRLAEVLSLNCQAKMHLPSLNALLKCIDTLCSCLVSLKGPQKSRLAWLLDTESELVEIARTEDTNTNANTIDPPTQPGGDLGTFNHLAFLAADTIRSRGYAQALAAHGVKLGKVVIIKTPGNVLRWGQSDATLQSEGELDGYFSPDLTIPLEETCKAISDHVEYLETGTVNCPEVIAALSTEAFDLAIYSGFGGELVHQNILQAAPPLLHMHAGWLPDYRGSTTTYYSWLREGVCGVSAILLSSEIDEGAILDRKRYPSPPPNMDADYLHDSVLRSDLLLSVMTHLAQAGSLPNMLQQKSDEGDTYYIIHPVLKHLAILSNGSR